ncbi:hypothetical protein COO60DRAFT_739211 [Scenedesmus sp. NREL 46B-D3]|nr:hypothetical protein COO60DRAFT_739211 [Scenedesmus sp. NREL 46B-D3]
MVHTKPDCQTTITSACPGQHSWGQHLENLPAVMTVVMLFYNLVLYKYVQAGKRPATTPHCPSNWQHKSNTSTSHAIWPSQVPARRVSADWAAKAYHKMQDPCCDIVCGGLELTTLEGMSQARSHTLYTVYVHCRWHLTTPSTAPNAHARALLLTCHTPRTPSHCVTLWQCCSPAQAVPRDYANVTPHPCSGSSLRRPPAAASSAANCPSAAAADSPADPS